MLPWGKLPGIALSAAVVAVLEETLFRGAIFGLLRRALAPFAALFLTTTLFAIVHFLKPSDDLQISAGRRGRAGFARCGYVFDQFAEPMKLLAGFTTLFVLGWMLGYATLRTRALWMSIGLHAGVVFVKMSFAKLTKREARVSAVGRARNCRSASCRWRC